MPDRHRPPSSHEGSVLRLALGGGLPAWAEVAGIAAVVTALCAVESARSPA
jgi:hypothetical protein